MTFRYIGVHGMAVPEWIEKQTPNGPGSVIGKVSWVGLTLVSEKNGAYVVRPVFPSRYVMKLSGADNVTVQGQSPEGGDGGVVISLDPVFPAWFLITLTLIMWAYNFGAFQS